MNTSFHEWVQLILIVSEDIKVKLQHTYDAVNYRLG